MLRSGPRHPASWVANWLGGVPFGGGWTLAPAIWGTSARADAAARVAAHRRRFRAVDMVSSPFLPRAFPRVFTRGLRRPRARRDDPFVGEARGVVGLFHGLLGGAFEQAVAGLVPGQDRGPQVGDGGSRGRHLCRGQLGAARGVEQLLGGDARRMRPTGDLLVIVPAAQGRPGLSAGG